MPAAQPAETGAAARIANEAAETVGDTPLVVLARLGEGLEAEVCAKLEYFNPGGSVKDRIGVAMIEAAEARGSSSPDARSSSRRPPATPASPSPWSAPCAVIGLILTLPEDMSAERGPCSAPTAPRSMRRRRWRACRAASPAEAHRQEGRRLHAEAVRQPRQPGDPRGTTAEEIWPPTGGEIEAFVAGVGTGGTITGVGQVLKSAPRVPGDRCRARDCDALGRREGAAQDPGHRRRLRAGGARPLGDRRGDPGQRRRRPRHGRALRAPRGASGRVLGRGRDPRGAGGRQAARDGRQSVS